MRQKIQPVKILPVLLGLVLVSGLAGAQAARGAEEPGEGLDAERAAVVAVVNAAYVDGIHNFRDPEAVRAGFHPDFEMLVLRDGQLTKLPLAKWIERLEAQNAENPPPAERVRTASAEFPIVDVTGTAAICKVELTRDGKHLFTDYLALYKFEDGWKIVGKSYYLHP